MKSIAFYLFAFFFVGTLMTACQQDPASDDPSGDQPGTGEVISDAQVVSSNGLPVVGGENGQISPQTLSLIENLTRDYWYVEQWAELSQGRLSREAADANRGRWFDFEENGTFTMGKLDKSQGSGTWIYDPQQAYLTMEVPDGENMEFSVKMARDGKVMLLVGTERYNQNNIQTKMENYVELMAKMPEVTN